MRWFRLYAEVVHDPKVQRLPAELFKAWVNCLCLAAESDGPLPSAADIAYHLRMTEPEAERILADLGAAGLLDKTKNGLTPHNWHGRQYRADHSAERMRRMRDRQRVTETSRHTSVTVTPPEQNRAEQSRIDAEQSQTATLRSGIESSPVRQIALTRNVDDVGVRRPHVELQPSNGWFGEFWNLYPRKVAKKTAAAAFGKAVRTEARWLKVKAALQAQLPGLLAREPEKRPHASTWLNQERWNDEPDPAGQGRPAGSGPAERHRAEFERKLDERLREAARERGIQPK